MSEETDKPDMAPGVIGWNEVMTSDKAGSVAFYTKLFGWTTEDMQLPDGATYTTFKQGDRPVAGCMALDGKEAQPMWLNYVNVADIDASIAKAKRLGGTILEGRTDLPIGSFAVIADPQSAVFAFWQANPEADNTAS